MYLRSINAYVKQRIHTYVKVVGLMAYFKNVITCLFDCTSLARGYRNMKTVQLAENEVRALCIKSREIFLNQPILLELEAPLKVCGECV